MRSVMESYISMKRRKSDIVKYQWLIIASWKYREYSGQGQFRIKAADEKSARRILHNKLIKYYGDGFTLRINEIRKNS